MKEFDTMSQLRIRTRIALALCSVATLVTLLTLELPRSRLQAALETAGHARLDQAAEATRRLLEDAQRRVGERHRALSRTPEFRANLETGDVETLAVLADSLVRREASIDAVLFSNSRARIYAAAGDRALRRDAARIPIGPPRAGAECGADARDDRCDALDVGGEPVRFASGGRLVLGTTVPLFARDRFIGRVTLLERQSDSTLASWSRLSGANIDLVPPEHAISDFDRAVADIPPLSLRLRGSFEREQAALDGLRDTVLSAGLLALCIAFVLAAPLSASLVAPLSAIKSAAARIREGDRSTRIRSGRTDEVGEVADAIDTMLDHLESTQAGLERAQQIGRLGSWRWQAGDDRLETSRQLVELLELPPETESVPLSVFLRRVHPEERDTFEAAFRRCEREGVPVRVDHRLVRTEGDLLAVETCAERVVLGDGVAVIDGTVQDVSEQRRSEERIRALAFEDSLTGLGNRRSFADELQLSIKESRRELRPLALIYLDLDDFKIVNDTLGHRVGDELLGCVAELLVEAISELEPDIRRASVHRLGGDEFAVVLPEIDDLDAVRLCAEKILQRLSSPIQLGDYEISVSASVGISTWPDEGLDVESLLLGCDTAMYHAKVEGRGQYRFYDRSMRETSERRFHLESRIRQAIDHDEFDVIYQPKVAPTTGRVVGFEALLRWRDPMLGMVSPEEFVGVAEETGQILALGEWTLLRVVRQVKSWHDAFQLEVPVSVNVSSVQIESSSLLDALVLVLHETDLPAHLIELEVTESALMRFEHRAIEMLDRLKETGVSISLDDFGTGYSSLAYLRRLPIDTIKIDRSFVVSIAEDDRDRQFVESIHSMARILGLGVVVEGVETPEQLDLLEAIGCGCIQGFVYSAAVRAADVPEVARRGFRPRTVSRSGPGTPPDRSSDR